MTGRVRLFQRALQAGSGIGDVAGAAYRGTLLLSEASALARMADTSQDVALKVFGAKQYYLLFIQTQDELSRVQALALTSSLAADAPKLLKGTDLASVSNTLLGWRRVLEEGADDLARAGNATRLEHLAEQRGRAYLERVAARSSGERLIEIASSIDLAIGRALINPVSSAERRALELFIRAVQPSDVAAWESVVGKIAAFSKAGDKVGELRAAGTLLDEEAFRKLLRPEASALKGHLLETWFWRAQAWTSREPVLMEAAFARARRLGSARSEFQPVLISQPLLTIGGMGRRGGLEIYDGSIILARDYVAGSSRSVEAFLDVAVQIKAERNISAVRQVGKDVRREMELGGLTELRTRDGSLVIRLLQAPDKADALRLIVAPELPAAQRIAGLPPGVNVGTVPTLLNADQLDDLSYFLLRAALAP